jgi:hypothetical protein
MLFGTMACQKVNPCKHEYLDMDGVCKSCGAGYFDPVAPVRAVTRVPGPQKDCPACISSRVHTVTEEMLFHPFAKHGYDKQVGWSHPDLEAWHLEQLKARAAASVKN